MTPNKALLDQLVETLIGHAVQFVVIGGFAVLAHRYVRATRDIDILIPDDAANDRRVSLRSTRSRAAAKRTQRS